MKEPIVYDGISSLKKANAEFMRHFKIPIKGFVDLKLSAMLYKVQIDLFAFEEHLKSKGYNEDNQSLSEFVEEKYGKEAVEFVENLL